MVFLNDIQRHITGQIRIGEPLAKYTSFGVGGPADYYIVPASTTDLVQAIAYLRNSALPFFLLTRGSNLLVSDKGYRGAALMLEPGLAHVRYTSARDSSKGGLVRAEAGVRLATFVEYCVERSLRGAEVLAGTRGTIGGWVAKNFGRNGSSPIESIIEVDLLRDGEVTKWREGNANLAESTINPQNDIVLAAAFRFTTGVKEEILRTRREWLVKRNAIEPVNLANAGSIFKDHSGWKAADLIGRAGLKGRCHGRARISETNANFIVADVGATASDVLALIELMQRKVRRELNVRLELKVKLVGFDRQRLQKVA